jgi:hypothetical protein
MRPLPPSSAAVPGASTGVTGASGKEAKAEAEMTVLIGYFRLRPISVIQATILL